MKGAYDFNAAQVCHNLLFHWGLFFSVLKKQIDIMKNKPSAQAAGANPFLCNSANRQNPPIQQNLITFEPVCYFMTESTIFNHYGMAAL